MVTFLRRYCPNQWSQIVITREASTRKSTVYINGQFLSSHTGTSDINYDGNQYVRLGTWGGGERNWNGKIDEVRIYDRALSAEEIKKQYYEFVRPEIHISTNKTTYSPGDTMNVTLNINNPTASPVTLEYYIGIPQMNKWIYKYISIIPAGHNETKIVPMPVRNYGSKPFGLINYALMLNSNTGEVLSQDSALVVYKPHEHWGNKKYDAAEDIEKSVEEVE